MSLEFEKELKVTKTNIPGLLVFDLPVHGDNRGWFKENWQRAKMTALGLPDFGPVQNNISFNAKKGVTRGIHAEPWDKYISIATGEIFGAWVDLRPGDSFGQVFTTRLDPSKAIYVPRGVGNSFQALQDGTAYTYLVNAHWSLEQKKTYTFVNLADPELNIQWPIPLVDSERSEADLHHPMLKDAKPMAPKRTMVFGSNGKLGRAIRRYAESHGLHGFEYHDTDTFDIADAKAYAAINWDLYGTIINAAAFTAVDEAETPGGRKNAWRTNVQGVKNLARIATEHRITLVHISSDYVFDGTKELHTEDEEFAPLGVYGQTKAAGDALVENVPQHYLLRSSWVIGEGRNFVTDGGASYGTYNMTGSGRIASWYDIARLVFQTAGVDPDTITANSVAEYAREHHAAMRPQNCSLDLSKLEATGYHPQDWEQSLATYLAKELEQR